MLRTTLCRCTAVLVVAAAFTGCRTWPVDDDDSESAAATVPTPWRTFGHSVEGRPLRVRSIGGGPVQVVWIGGIHGDEVEGAVATAELPAAIAERPELARRVTLHVVEDLNPDGRAAGTRGNAHGVDLNRNYPASNYRPGDGRGDAPLSEPEARALFALLDELQPDLVMVAHSWVRRGERPAAGINWDGPAAHYARIWSEHSDWEMVPSQQIHGTPGSLGTLVGIDRQVPILTMEWAKGTDPRTAWAQTRTAILAVLERAGAGT